MRPNLRLVLQFLTFIALSCLSGCASMDPPLFKPNLSLTPGMSLYEDDRRIGSHFTKADGTEVYQASLRHLLSVWYPHQLLVFDETVANADYYVAFQPGFAASESAKAAAVERAIKVRLVNDTRQTIVPVLLRLRAELPPRGNATGSPSQTTGYGPPEVRGNVTSRTTVYTLTNYSMADFAEWLKDHEVGGTIPVLDETGLAGRFNLRLVETTEFHRDAMSFCGPRIEQHLELAAAGFEIRRLPRPLKATYVSMDR